MKYNDGTEIERLKIDQTTGDLGQRFFGLSQDLVRVHGLWRSGGQSYHDKLLRIRIDSDDPKATAFFKSYKEILKPRFQQIDIWITAHEIEIIGSGSVCGAGVSPAPMQARRPHHNTAN